MQACGSLRPWVRTGRCSPRRTTGYALCAARGGRTRQTGIDDVRVRRIDGQALRTAPQQRQLDCSPVSPTASCGGAATRATPGRRCNSEGTLSTASSPSATRRTEPPFGCGTRPASWLVSGHVAWTDTATMTSRPSTPSHHGNGPFAGFSSLSSPGGAARLLPKRALLAPNETTKDVTCRQIRKTGATGLEPATSGVTDRLDALSSPFQPYGLRMFKPNHGNPYRSSRAPCGRASCHDIAKVEVTVALADD
jgi:hypothetical protein